MTIIIKTNSIGSITLILKGDLEMGYYKVIRKSVEYIEQNLCEKLSLESLAAYHAYSPYHFYRIFLHLTGISVMEYIRKRRLSEAADLLLQTDIKITDIAMQFQYQSHEAFTRAFKQFFGQNPGDYRKNGIYLKKFERLGEHELTALEFKGEIDHLKIRIVKKDAFKVIGYELDTALSQKTIPQFWNEYLENDYPCTIPNWSSKEWIDLGICHSWKADGSFKYLLGMEVTSFENAPTNSVCREFPSLTYAVFTTPIVPRDVFVSSIGKSWEYIFKEWLPKSGYEIAEGPQFELYDERCQAHIDSQIDIYIPICRKIVGG
jgi:AraC family transcriptional regulator